MRGFVSFVRQRRSGRCRALFLHCTGLVLRKERIEMERLMKETVVWQEMEGKERWYRW